MDDPLVVAVVDDDDSVRIALRRLLVVYGMQVLAYASGSDFLGSLPRCRPCCLVLDLHMPGLTGFDVLRRIGNGVGRIPTVAITGKDEPEMREQALALGASGYLTKPLDTDVLLAAMRDAVGPPSI